MKKIKSIFINIFVSYKLECESKNSPNKRHKWIINSYSSWTEGAGHKPLYLHCEYCGKLISAPELMQINALKNQAIATIVLIITTIIAFMSLMITIIIHE